MACGWMTPSTLREDARSANSPWPLPPRPRRRRRRRRRPPSPVASALPGAAALAAATAFRRAVQQWWADGWDLLVTPTMAATPAPLGEMAQNPDRPFAPFAVSAKYAAFTSPWNVTGQPAISLPIAHDDAGLPVGVQLVAAYGGEDVLIRIAAQIEAALPWHDRHPTPR